LNCNAGYCNGGCNSIDYRLFIPVIDQKPTVVIPAYAGMTTVEVNPAFAGLTALVTPRPKNKNNDALV